MIIQSFIGLALLFSGVKEHAQVFQQQTEERREYVRVTYYTLRGYSFSGIPTGYGAAACSMWIPLWSVLEFEGGYQVTCIDRGYGDRYWKGWVDVWAPTAGWGQQNVIGVYGDYTWVSVICWGPCPSD